MSIRKIRLDDYEQIKALEIQVHRQHQKARPDVFKKDESGVLNYEYFLQILNSKKYYGFVCVQDGKIVGELFAFLKTGSPAPFMKNRKVMFVESIAVDSNFRRSGIGTKLMNHLKNFAKKQGFEAIELNVWAFNNQAIDFYKSLGMNLKTTVFETKL